MANYILSQDFQVNEYCNRNTKQNLDNPKRKRITHYLVDKPIAHPFPIEKERESLLSIGEA